jgi:hypothetical protein
MRTLLGAENMLREASSQLSIDHDVLLSERRTFNL